MTLTWNTIAGQPTSYAMVTRHLGSRYSVIRKAKYVREFVVWRDGVALATFPTMEAGTHFVEQFIETSLRRAPAI